MTDKKEQRQNDPKASLNSQQKTRVPDVIAENRDSVIDTWLERAKTNPELMRASISDADRKDHVPDLLDEAIARACARTVSNEDRQRAAERHGTLRYHQGYSIAMLILEAQLLQHVIAECIRDNVDRIELKSLIPDIATLSDTITTELRESARAYIHQRESAGVQSEDPVN